MLVVKQDSRYKILYTGSNPKVNGKGLIPMGWLLVQASVYQLGKVATSRRAAQISMLSQVERLVNWKYKFHLHKMRKMCMLVTYLYLSTACACLCWLEMVQHALRFFFRTFVAAVWARRISGCSIISGACLVYG